MAERQRIDDRVLLAARRAIARARGQEMISVEPVEQGVSPSTSARLYKISTTGEIDAEAVSAASAPHDESHVPRETGASSRASREGRASGFRSSFSRRDEESAANVVVPRGPAADTAARVRADAAAGANRRSADDEHRPAAVAAHRSAAGADRHSAAAEHRSAADAEYLPATNDKRRHNEADERRRVASAEHRPAAGADRHSAADGERRYDKADERCFAASGEHRSAIGAEHRPAAGAERRHDEVDDQVKADECAVSADPQLEELAPALRRVGSDSPSAHAEGDASDLGRPSVNTQNEPSVDDKDASRVDDHNRLEAPGFSAADAQSEPAEPKPVKADARPTGFNTRVGSTNAACEQAPDIQKTAPQQVTTPQGTKPIREAAAMAGRPLDSVGRSTQASEDDMLAKALEPKPRSAFRDDSAPVPRVGADFKFSEGLPTRKASVPEEAGAFLDVFFAQLKRCGVKNVVISPGSRSTPLAMKAYEHYGDVYVNIDERSAAFFALGLAKATGNVVALVCPGGTAVGNWMPAVLEAEASRVPLLLLSADHPSRLQGVGAPHACDQLHLFGQHVRKFVQMPLPSMEPESLAYARQVAMDACIAAHGALPNVASADAGPVHLNFPFEEPLKPERCCEPIETSSLPAAVVAGQGLLAADVKGLFGLIKNKRVIALCGEGTCESVADARQLLNFAHMRNVPLLADPLSGLRCYSDSMIIDHYDAIFGGDRAPHAEVVIRFGRWPVSERAMQAVQKMDAIQVVVDMREPRDATSSTTLFVRCAPTVFAEAMAVFDSRDTASTRACKEWCELNNEAAEVVRGVRLRRDNGEMEGAYVYETMEAAPDGSLVFCANSMSIRALDTFYCKADKQLRVLCNRGLAGVDGTVSSALGAAQAYEQTTLIVGDLAFLRDVNALALQNEMRLREMHTLKPTPSVIVVLLNNGGAGIFDMMPQKSTEPYFERLFLAPQAVDYKRIADGFGVTCRTVSSVNTFRRTYASLVGEAGINIIEVLVPLAGIQQRYGDYWKL